MCARGCRVASPAVDDRCFELVTLKVDPRFDNPKGFPEFIHGPAQMGVLQRRLNKATGMRFLHLEALQAFSSSPLKRFRARPASMNGQQKNAPTIHPQDQRKRFQSPCVL